MTAILPEVIIALIAAFLVITDWVLRMITGDKPRPRADDAVRDRTGTAPAAPGDGPQLSARRPPLSAVGERPRDHHAAAGRTARRRGAAMSNLTGYFEVVDRPEFLLAMSPPCWEDACHDCPGIRCACACHDEPPPRVLSRPRRHRACGYLFGSAGHEITCGGKS